MNDRSSARHTQHAKTPVPVVRKIVHLRWKQRLGPVQIGAQLDMPASTVHAVLVRCRLNRLTHIDRVTGEPARRYERSRPGELIHVDVTKFGNIPDGGGWRFVGRRARRPRTGRPPATAPAPTHASYHPKVGTCFVHTVIDDYSRVAYAECHDDETPPPRSRCCTGPWPGSPSAASSSSGCCPTTARPTSPTCGATPAPSSASRTKKTRPRRPQTNGKIERLHRTMADGWAYKKLYTLRERPPSRAGRMAPPVQPPPAPLSTRRPTTHHPVGQPGWTSH